MRRTFQVGTWLLLLVVFLAPVCELFDRWDAPGLGDDTEMAVFVFVLLLCLLLAVCKLIRGRAEQTAVVLVGILWPEPPDSLHLQQAFVSRLVIPPIAAPLRI